MSGDRTRVCSVAGCGRPVSARGMCQTHNKHMRKSGAVRPIRVHQPPRTGRTVRLPGGVVVTPECAAAVDSYAREHGYTRHRVVTDVLEDWAQTVARSGDSTEPG